MVTKVVSSASNSGIRTATSCGEERGHDASGASSYFITSSAVASTIEDS